MKKLFFAAILMASSQALSAGFDVDVENFTASNGIAEAVLKVTNNTGADARSVFVDCVFFDKNKRALDIGKALIPAIAAGDHAFDKAAITRTEGVEFVECGVKRSR
jgi:hypothetical protein